MLRCIKKKVKPKDVLPIVDGWRKTFTLFSVDEQALIQALNYVGKYEGNKLSFFDALWLATAKGAECDYFLTEDKAILEEKDYDGMQVRNPFVDEVYAEIENHLLQTT